MNTSQFLSRILTEVPEINLDEFPQDPIGYAEAGFIKLPLLGEITGAESVILNGFQSLTKKLNAKLDLLAKELKKRYNCKRADIVSEIVESLACNGLYNRLVEGKIQMFSKEGYEDLLNLMEKEYDPATLLYSDGGNDLRVMAYSMSEDLTKVQGESIENKVLSLSLKLPFISDYSMDVVDINPLLEDYKGIYEDYEAFLFSNAPTVLIRIFLFTRLGIDHDVLLNLRTSQIETLNEAVYGEIKKPEPVKSNKAKPKAKPKDGGETEEEDDKSS
jgi:hypothetical protein